MQREMVMTSVIARHLTFSLNDKTHDIYKCLAPLNPFSVSLHHVSLTALVSNIGAFRKEKLTAQSKM